ncbi:MAG: hypothetical protein Q9184_007114, partial [Pyrenodesmia sp. 2 TL-2023]
GVTSAQEIGPRAAEEVLQCLHEEKGEGEGEAKPQPGGVPFPELAPPDQRLFRLGVEGWVFWGEGDGDDECDDEGGDDADDEEDTGGDCSVRVGEGYGGVGPYLRQIRRESTNASPASSSTTPSSGGSTTQALIGGLAGGALVFAGGYSYYHFSGAKTLVNTAHQTKATLEKYTQQFKDSNPEPSEALRWLRSTAQSYAAFIPGARGYVDAFFNDLEAIQKKHGPEVDSIVKEAYTELKDTVVSEGMSITSATRSWTVLQKYMNRIAELAGDASEDILNNHPALKDKVGGNINQLKQMGENYGPEAKKQVEETWSQIQDIVKGGIGASTIPQVQSLIQDKTQKMREMGNKLWDEGMEKAKPLLDKSPEVKKIVEENKDKLKQGNVQELYEMIKESVQSGNTDKLKEYVNNTVNKAKRSTSGGGSGIEQYLQMVPGGGEIVPQLTKMYQIAQEHGEEAEKIAKEAVHEIEDVLKRRTPHETQSFSRLETHVISFERWEVPTYVQMAPAGLLFVRFALNAFSYVAIFCHPDSLASIFEFVEESIHEATVRLYTVDINDQAALTNALKQAISDFGSHEAVVYGDYSTVFPRSSTIGEYLPQAMLIDFEVVNLAIYAIATITIPHLQRLTKFNPVAHPSFFVNSEVIIHPPEPSNFSLSMAKAAQASLVRSLAEANKGVVHVALVTVGGAISP